jgi:tetratricopeptide (TPR) repeat protein
LWLERVEDLIPAQPPDVQKELLEGAGIIASETGDDDRAWQFAERAIALLRTVPDRGDLARALVFGGITAIGRSDLDRAAQLLEEGRQLGIEIDDQWSRAFGTFNLAEVRLTQNMYEETDALLEEAIEYFRAAGGVFGVGLSLVSRGVVALHQGRIDDARAFFLDAIRLSSEHLGSGAGKARIMLMGALEGLAHIAAEERSLERAARLFGAAEQLRDEGGFLEQESERFVRQPVQAALDMAGDTVAAARAEGRAMDEAEAAAYAVSTARPGRVRPTTANPPPRL